MKRYDLLPTDSQLNGKPLYRIRHIATGEHGGLVHGYHNLSQKGTCWIDFTSKVIDAAVVKDHAIVRYGSIVFNSAIIQDSAIVEYDCTICDNAVVKDHARIRRNSMIYDNAQIDGSTYITNSQIYGNSRIMQTTLISNAIIKDDAIVKGEAVIEGAPNNPIIVGGWIVIHGYMKLVVGCYVNTKPLYLEFIYPVTVNDEDHICIGCQVRSLAAWRRYRGTSDAKYDYLNKVLDLIEYHLANGDKL